MNRNDTLESPDLSAQTTLPEKSDREPTLPIGMGDFEGDIGADPLAGAEEGVRLNTGVILIVVVVVVAAVGLFSMRKLSQMSSFGGEGGAEIERIINQFLTSIGAGGDASLITDPTADARVLEVIEEGRTELQVPWANVRKDPFEFSWQESVTEDIPTDDPEKALAARRAAREDQFERGASRLKLKSTLMGSTPLANINDKILRVGETMSVEAASQARGAAPTSVTYRIMSIKGESVTVRAEDPELEVVVDMVVHVDRNLP